MATYRVPEGAHAELKAEAERLTALVRSRIITAEQGQRVYFEKVRKVLGECLIRCSPGEERRDFPILCNGCGKVVIVASDVTEYRCRCSPNVIRFTVTSRNLNLKIGKGAIEDLMSDNVGRQTLTFPT